jgi:hypothetical protein
MAGVVVICNPVYKGHPEYGGRGRSGLARAVRCDPALPKRRTRRENRIVNQLPLIQSSRIFLYKERTISKMPTERL